MSEEWIRLNAKLLNHHPRVLELVSKLDGAKMARWATHGQFDVLRTEVEAALVVCALVRTWCAANEHGVIDNHDMVMRHANLKTVDDITGIEGFGQAMVAIDWLQQEGDSTLRFPRFLTYNIPPAERRRRKDALRKVRTRCGQNADTLRTKCGKKGATEQNRTEQNNTPVEQGLPVRSGVDLNTKLLPAPVPDLHQSHTGPDRTAKPYMQTLVLRIATAFDWKGDGPERQKRALYAVAKRAYGLPNRKAIAEKLVSLAEAKARDPTLEKPVAAWQAEVNRIFKEIENESQTATRL